MKISICVGSSCHLRGSNKIVELMQEAIACSGISDRVELGAAFCLGKCTDGVSVRIDDEIISGFSPQNFAEMFDRYIMKRLL